MTWVLVADASRARIFNTAGSKEPLVEVKSMLHGESRLKVSELVSDQPGRQSGSNPSGSHGVAEKSAIKEQERDTFARELSDLLALGREQDHFRKLYLVAPSQMLGALHKHLNKNVKAALQGEFDLKLVKASNEDIRNHLPEYL
ncbi:host attachment protein [Porticoccus sp.]|nr:MAG: host attachment protein [Gammaproteobacteria bacterium]